MTKKTKEKAPNLLNRKQTQLIINGCELLDNKAQLSSDWNRIIKPEMVLLFEEMNNHSLVGLGVVKKKTHYSIWCCKTYEKRI